MKTEGAVPSNWTARTLALVILVLGVRAGHAQEDMDLLLGLSLEELMRIDVTLASGVEESIFDAPAAMVVVTAQDIQQRGYTNLAEIIVDLPGFDVVFTNGIPYLYAYQRGYRTPSTQRTLLMIDGQVDNHLWTHQATFSRRFPISSIERVEILYGPASAVYGPNAFLGIVNVVTHQGADLETDGNVADVRIHGGSYSQRGIDVTLRGRQQDLAYSLSGRVFRSDEPDLSGDFGFLDNRLYGDEQIWGPLLQQEHRNRSFGTYYDPTDDNGFLGSITYHDAKLGFVHWERKEGYGAQYVADRVQNNVFWNTNGSHLYGEVERQVEDWLHSSSHLSYRVSRTWGGWPEALPDWNEGMESYSYISNTNWNSISNSWLFKQQFEVTLQDVLITGGLKFERKELTKAYDIPGYWNAFSSTVAANAPGPHGLGAGIGHSSDSTYTAPPIPNLEMPPANLALTEDLGGFVQGIWDRDAWRFNAGIRWDDNSIYGRSINPRVSAVYKFSERRALKFLYSQAFQEPAPIQVWGGWNGRLSNPDLEPEKARNAEIIAMTQTGRLFHDASLYYSHYDDVIKEEAENAGSRDVWGLEYRGRFTTPNPLTAADLSGYFYYTYANVTSSTVFNHEAGSWENGDTDLGDIAPHKINVGINIPTSSGLNANLRANFVSERKLYSQNPLRAQGETIDAYVQINGALSWSQEPFGITLKVTNLLASDHFHPGVEQADSGNDFSQRSLGFRNSLVPQPGRSVALRLSMQY
ncbi:MAG: TonB-dependent receptor [Gemmatimonadetes bacterium]|nr:TonB-dependent receptor [Gemmatimonadota bacterium]MBT5055182.1 TonB-dependent receptor [Gemmatimonadota bacterium]MBT5962036.1 TonB-dependent receptor [Gemmatimonadota bacterium]MBT7452973.1 TonB-dependent receptor [Gemmatimonadota bacterium]